MHPIYLDLTIIAGCGGFRLRSKVGSHVVDDARVETRPLRGAEPSGYDRRTRISLLLE